MRDSPEILRLPKAWIRPPRASPLLEDEQAADDLDENRRE
jgi:hypothetical protein